MELLQVISLVCLVAVLGTVLADFIIRTMRKNIVSKEVIRSLLENQEKIRMEKELETAKAIQGNILPPPSFTDNKVQVNGFFQSASECAGDWWYYHVVENKCLVIIGDATGHGVHSALITSAARAALSSCIRQNIFDPGKVLEEINRTIFDVSQGHMYMTAFCGLFDFSTNELSYSSASHEFPLFKNLSGKTEFLTDVVGPRLGDNENSIYKTAVKGFSPGDRLLIYTDGITEAHNSRAMHFGDRRLFKGVESFNGTDLIEYLLKEVKRFSGSKQFDDDLTIVDVVIRH